MKSTHRRVILPLTEWKARTQQKAQKGVLLENIRRPNWGEPFPPNMKRGNLTAAFHIRVTYQDRVQVTVMGHTVSGEDLQDALAQAFQVVALEQYTEGRTKGYEEGNDEFEHCCSEVID